MNLRNLLLIPISCGAIASAAAQTAPPPASGPPVTQLDPVIVTGELDESRETIVPSLGATSFIMDQQQILNMPQGADAPFNQVLLRAPGVAEDSAANGDLHVRGEHANLQYRINDVLLPEGISGFGLELDPRFVNSMQLITGSLPAQYGFRTAGVVDIQTKGGAFEQGGEVSLYAGSYDTVRPSFELGGSEGKLTYFADGSYDHNAIGIENPTASATPVHDDSDQYKAFTYVSYILDSAGLNENQDEQNYFAVAAYQKSSGELNYQLSAFARDSSVQFTPDPVGDLYFNGVASDVGRRLHSVGLQGDASYELGAAQTLRGGFTLLDEFVSADSTTTVFPVDGGGDPTGPAFAVADDEALHGLFAGAYLQDEWKILHGLTLNFGARFDVFDSSFDDESQLSPRVNFIYKASDSTTVHAGYARYFTPPPVENVPGRTVAEFDGTSNQSAVTQDDPVRAERSNYFDAGISQKLARGFQAGLDGYYKRADNQLDDGLFGQTLILSAFNYARGEVYGLELTGSYENGGFSAYINLAKSVAKGEDWNSAQFLFSPDDLAYVRDHWIFLDHDQALTGSFGASYHWKEARGDTRVYVDALYGTGLRTDSTAPGGTVISNGGTVPPHYTISVGGEQSFKIGIRRSVKVRLDILNLTDNSYELRSGTGVGVNAAQYGMRRGIFGSVSYSY